MSIITDWFSFLDTWGILYLRGALTTLKISLISVLIGLLLGLLIGIMRLSKNKIANGFSAVYVELIRGTPLVVQVMIFYYGFSSVIPPEYDWLKNAFILSTAAICINSSAYVAEIIRGGIQSVDRGQIEAARSLGMNHKQTMREIVIPQAVKIVLPSLGNEFISLIKESAIVAFVGIEDLMFQAKVISGSTYRYFMPYITVALIYFAMVYGLSRLQKIYERRLKASDSH